MTEDPIAAAIARALGSPPSRTLPSFEITPREPWGAHLQFEWGVAGGGILGFDAPAGADGDSYVAFDRDTGSLMPELLNVAGWGFFIQLYGAANDTDRYTWRATVSAAGQVEGVLSYDPADQSLFFPLPPADADWTQAAVIEIKADPANASRLWDFRRMRLTPFQP